jgi:MFS family permease
MRKRRDYASVLIWAAVLVTVVRYAGAFIASDLGEITGWVSEALSLAMGLTGLGMGVLDVLGGAYIFDGWRRSMPRAGQKWPFRFRTLTVFAFGLFAIGIWILVPFTVSRVSHQTMEQVLGIGWGLWTWSVAVNVAPYILIGGVVTGNVGVVGVNMPEGGRAFGGKLPESAGEAGKVGGLSAGQMGPHYRDWREVPESEWRRIAGMSTASAMRAYRVKEKTARNWRHYAAQALEGRLASPQAELFPPDPDKEGD